MKALLIFAFLFIQFDSFAQTKIWNNWYFTDSVGLNFNTQPPSPQYGKIRKETAAASISDDNGNLLFYTDGYTVFDQLHDTMPNGRSIIGLDTLPYTAIIVPKPGSNHLYYIFSASQAKIYYSIVDMQLNNAKGDIVTTLKAIPLSDDTNGLMAIAQTADKKGYWIVSHSAYGNPISFLYSFKISNNGVNNVPVLTSDTTYIEPNTVNYNMRISPDSKILASQTDKINMNLYHFDNETGILQKFYSTELKYQNFKTLMIHGFEFSNNSEKLYVITSGIIFTIGAYSRIYQFDLSTTNITYTTIYEKENELYRNLQMGPDKKIYLVNHDDGFHNKLSVINKPNLSGSLCNFVENIIIFNIGSTYFSALPYCYFFPESPLDFSTTNHCQNDNTQFTINHTTNIQSALWQFGDSQTSTILNPTHTYTNAGTYTIILTVTYNDNSTDTITKDIEIYNKPLKPTIEHK